MHVKKGAITHAQKRWLILLLEKGPLIWRGLVNHQALRVCIKNEWCVAIGAEVYITISGIDAIAKARGEA